MSNPRVDIDCPFWVCGYCKNGISCDYKHDPEKLRSMPDDCPYWLLGNCKFRATCRKHHDDKKRGLLKRRRPGPEPGPGPRPPEPTPDPKPPEPTPDTKPPEPTPDTRPPEPTPDTRPVPLPGPEPMPESKCQKCGHPIDHPQLGSNCIVDFQGHAFCKRCGPGSLFSSWAVVPDWNEMLKNLASIAVEERWNFPSDPDNGRMPILKSYIRYTFYRLLTTQKVHEHEGEGWAVFDTGLVTRIEYDPIIACFKRNGKKSSPPWVFDHFCVWGQSGEGKIGDGKRVAAIFERPPKKAEYFTDPREVFFDSEKKLNNDFEHMIMDNLDRLPKHLLLKELGTSNIEEGKKKLTEDRVSRKNLRDKLENGIRLAIKRTGWNYKTVVPAFYPTRDIISLLFPVDLCYDGKPDVALVVSREKSGAYQGQTILTLEMALKSSRLICRPNSDWLEAPPAMPKQPDMPQPVSSPVLNAEPIPSHVTKPLASPVTKPKPAPISGPDRTYTHEELKIAQENKDWLEAQPAKPKQPDMPQPVSSPDHKPNPKPVPNPNPELKPAPNPHPHPGPEPDSGRTYSYKELIDLIQEQKQSYHKVDLDFPHIEMYLCDEEFQTLFHMSKIEFEKKRPHVRLRLKKEVGLF